MLHLNTAYAGTGKDTLYTILVCGGRIVDVGTDGSLPAEYKLSQAWRPWLIYAADHAVKPDYGDPLRLIRVAFADALKVEAFAQLKLAGTYKDYEKIKNTLQVEVPEGGTKTLRQHYIDHGTKRRKEDIDYWVKRALADVNLESLVTFADLLHLGHLKDRLFRDDVSGERSSLKTSSDVFVTTPKGLLKDRLFRDDVSGERSSPKDGRPSDTKVPLGGKLRTYNFVTDWRFLSEIGHIEKCYPGCFDTSRLFDAAIRPAPPDVQSEHELDFYKTDYLLVPTIEQFPLAVKAFPQYADYKLRWCIIPP